MAALFVSILRNIDKLYSHLHLHKYNRVVLKLAQIQTNFQKIPLLFISYGFEIKNLKPFKILSIYYIYKIQPKNNQKVFFFTIKYAIM